jgi:hypothetical protein
MQKIERFVIARVTLLVLQARRSIVPRVRYSAQRHLATVRRTPQSGRFSPI